MTLFVLLRRALVAVAFGVVAGSLPAMAQGFDPDERVGSAPITTRPQVFHRQNGPIVREYVDNSLTHPITYRVTTGSTTNQGWEHDLVQGTPNLKHWTWVPVTSYNQGYVRIGPKQAKKPEHINIANLPRPKGGIYVKPTKVALPKRKYDWRYLAQYDDNGGNHATTDVSAKVKLPKRPSAPAYAYAGSYSNYGTGDATGSLTSQDVHGKIVGKNTTH